MKFRELQIRITKITNAKFRELQIWFFNRELKDRGPQERSSGFYIINLVPNLFIFIFIVANCVVVFSKQLDS